MSTFYDRERLILALEKGKIPPHEETILKLDLWLRSLRVKYGLVEKGLLGRRMKPSRELKNLQKAFEEWLTSQNRQSEQNLFHSFGPLKLTQSPMVMFAMVYNTIFETIKWLEAEQPNTRREQDLRTDLFIGLYQGYVELSGNKGLGNEGPGIKFMTECSSLIGAQIPSGGRRTLQLAINARQQRGARITWADTISTVWKTHQEGK